MGYMGHKYFVGHMGQMGHKYSMGQKYSMGHKYSNTLWVTNTLLVKWITNTLILYGSQILYGSNGSQILYGSNGSSLLWVVGRQYSIGWWVLTNEQIFKAASAVILCMGRGSFGHLGNFDRPITISALLCGICNWFCIHWDQCLVLLKYFDSLRWLSWISCVFSVTIIVIVYCITT